MRSIRRSLVLYFLALMAVVLGAVGVLIDRVAVRTLATREAAAQQLIDLRYADLAREESEKLDADLEILASRVANDIQWNYYQLGQKDFEQYIIAMRVAPLGSLAAGLTPWPVTAPLWHQINFNRRLNESVARNHFSKLHLEAMPSIEDSGRDLIHVTIQAQPQNRVFRSHSLEGENWVAVVPSFDAAKLIDKNFETRKLQDGTNVRVLGLKSPISVMLRTPGGRSYFPTGLGSNGGSGTFVDRDRRGPRGDSPPRTDPNRPESLPRPSELPRSQEPPRPEPPPMTEQPPQVPFRTAYIQCGRSLLLLEAKLATFELQRDQEKANETEKTRREQFGLRAWLGLIGSLAFLGLIGGGLMLVKRGLRPLDTLTAAVAKVSERDFRLPVERHELSAELLPIHDRLTETLSQLKRAFEHDKEAVADISHELRTPVASLLATLDVSLRKPRTTEQYKQTIEDCRGITKQLASLVERVMLLASLDSAPHKVNASEVDGSELAEGCAAVIRPLAEAHGLTLSVDAPNPIPIHTDADKLREVLMNLLHNAVEYNRPGGNVSLSVRNGGPTAVFAVKDTGIGMTDDVRARIFDRFYRADPSRTATGLHAGLGLAIVKECVDRLGGRISVESQPGKGSEFKVELPA
ncbi:hypothetical protein BH11PLA2_BH11PLA2_43690 [soil metagenome]